MKLKLLLAALVFLLFTSTGCVYLLQKTIQSTYPTYEESLAKMNEITQNYGRLFIYAKEDLIRGILTVAIFDIQGYKDNLAIFPSNTFVFVDLPEGEYSLNTHGREFFMRKDYDSVPFKISEGEIKFIEIYFKGFSHKNSKVRLQDQYKGEEDIKKCCKHRLKKVQSI